MKLFLIMLTIITTAPINTYAVCDTFNNKPLCTDNQIYNIIPALPGNKALGSSEPPKNNINSTNTTSTTSTFSNQIQNTRITKKQTYQFSYEETNGLIDTASVCQEYEYGSLDQRQCRSYATDVFTEKCQENTRLAGSYKYPNNIRYVELRDKFCTASRSIQ